ncbi:hypothetical protein GCM10012290_10630 [Halolactibacillus alkaliphilus]|uniref:Uncharacterized protein n=1 Tax=Halolactibacillus alkaliphilus TaxID=442899 RepID=A0A511X2B7_9BACI|nr:hypothetical protein [Halolactibacillus alkaliphilus]GEN57061.1 hypothetical protein HAL01_15250 [Halolactibacillus alkaliphilus]GGN68678.1 hypothetical protein GCM10012290_10630 [Halolactibacillus alkaliphilus]SFO86122.1 hypothetical protein SAMN05720591_11739 [Halolactibacillus alkaliphilus]
MKRFLIISLGFSILIFIGVYLYFVEGVYWSFRAPETIDTPFYTEDQQFYYATNSGAVPIDIKGIEVDASFGPYRANDFTIDDDTWLRWFQLIKNTGANTVRVSTIMDDTFYRALYDYNSDNNDPLFLLQGIRVAYDEVNMDQTQGQMRFYNLLKEDARDAIDIVHGRNFILGNNQKGSGLYRYNLSPWVLGYLIGDEWNQDLISYINHTLTDDFEDYVGTYIETSFDSTAFEKLIASLIDDMIRYETNKYHTQRPISVNSTFVMDPFEYHTHIKQQLGKINRFTMDHFLLTEHQHAGLFASYAYEDWPEEASEYILNEKTNSTSFSDYLTELQEAHNMPVIISSFGYPSDMYLNQEDDQGVLLIGDLQLFEESGFNGAIIRSLQDVWDRRTVQTAFKYALEEIHEWHDALTPTQHFGLIGFESYRKDTLMRIDGAEDDWVDVAYTKEDTLKVTRDHSYLYVLAKSVDIDPDQPLYLSFDIHPTMGTTLMPQKGITLEAPSEFLLAIRPNMDGIMYVIERYQGARQQFLERVNGVNPYVVLPERPNSFVRVVVAERTKEITQEDATDYTYPYQFKEVSPLKSQLTPSVSPDIYITDKQVELRIPYGLLNMYDPMKPTVHDDYYENYGVEPLSINQFTLSIYNEEGIIIDSVVVPLNRLHSTADVEEIIKPAYYQVKAHWGGGAE